MGCGKQMSMESGVDRMKPGMGYVPWQKFQQILDPEDALKNGTIFKELVLPYTGIRGRGGNCNG
ncbi:MAG: spore coat associated protein CotJA [Lachnospiraceae bacterium]|nr:spore coat associated protein CotJA [Lachnospiraceae bacterium]MBQ5559682.1 spore coat associated protein CotJA [Lachnospiraceae bacterium]MCR4803536.1 spore coat associated protein CotJA [Lachnospiraceae bacterium]